MKPKGAAATSRDVARLAGVSQPTVSRALRSQAGVAAETVRRVEKAAAELGYVPSQLGRGLATRSTRRIGIVAAELTNPFYPHLVVPLHNHFQQAGYRTVLFTEREDSYVAFADLVDGLLDGVVLTTTLLNARLPEELERRGLPFVFLNRTSNVVEGDAVVVDNTYGGALVADLLVELGHRRIGALLGPKDTSTGSEREAGFRARLASHGLELTSDFTTRGAFSFIAGAEGIRALLGAARPPTAVFCGNDVVALGAIDEATRLGARIPEDITIVGFDDIAMSSWKRFDLTTVHCDLESLAAIATDLLLKRIVDPNRMHSRVVQTPQLMLRSTHGKPQTRTSRTRKPPPQGS